MSQMSTKYPFQNPVPASESWGLQTRSY